MSCALSRSPYINGSFPITIPHSISNAAAPDTNAVESDVPSAFSYIPFPADTVIFTPGAAISGFIQLSVVYPRPEKLVIPPVFWSYEATDITLFDVEGIVSEPNGTGFSKYTWPVT